MVKGPIRAWSGVSSSARTGRLHHHVGGWLLTSSRSLRKSSGRAAREGSSTSCSSARYRRRWLGGNRMFVTLAYMVRFLPVPRQARLLAGTPPCVPDSKVPQKVSANLAQPSALDLVDKAADTLLVWDERASLDASNRLAHILLQI